MRALLILLGFALPASADSLCGETDVLERLSGEWEREVVTSLDNETLAMLRREPVERVWITDDGALVSDFTDSVMGRPVPLIPQAPGLYDVDTVDDLLDATENAELANILSDTPCGPEDLPQLTAHLPAQEGMSAAGTVTLVAFFDDRLLELTELELLGPGAVIFMTRTALWTRFDQ